MTKLLYIEASPRKERSHSIETAHTLIESYRQANPDHEVETWDLWSAPLPEFDEAAINASYAAGQGGPLTPDQQAAWDNLNQHFKRFASADKYVFGVPMWNFGVPYKLKHLLDVLTQPGLAFRVTPDGAYEGLLGNRPTALVMATGATYDSGPMAAMDHAEPFVKTWLGFVGLTDVRTVRVAPTAADPETVAAAKARAAEEARKVGAAL